MSNLISCPFCGGEAEKRYHDVYMLDYVKCRKCGAQTALCANEAEADAAWNTRAERMCRNVSIKHEGVFICSDCGVYLDIAYMEDAEKDYEPKFCPNCGAKVVKE